MSSSAESATTVGHLLHAGRQRAGLSLKEVAERTCIRRAYLEALEADRYDLLPGEVYAQGFTRLYAQAIGLDADPLLAQIRHLKATGSVWVEEPAEEKKAGLSAVLLWGLVTLVVFGVVVGFLYRLWYAPPLAEKMPPAPAPVVLQEVLPVVNPEQAADRDEMVSTGLAEPAPVFPGRP
jgi:cytoskeleton protein RodZ